MLSVFQRSRVVFGWVVVLGGCRWRNAPGVERGLLHRIVRVEIGGVASCVQFALTAANRFGNIPLAGRTGTMCCFHCFIVPFAPPLERGISLV
jgi:hypothetical protein